MKTFVFALSLLPALAFLAPSFSSADEYAIDPSHSSVGFKIRHLVSKVSGSFKEFDGKFTYDKAHLDKSMFEGRISASSINTSNEKRDEHLRSPDFFDAKKFPNLTFKSTKIRSKGKDMLEITGDFTMKGVTKPVTLTAELGGEVKDPWGNTKFGMEAKGKLNRKDFGMEWNKALDHGGVMLGDEIELELAFEAENLTAKKAAPAAAPAAAKPAAPVKK